MRYKCVSCVCPVPAPADGVLGATYDLAFSGLSLPVLPMLHLCFPTSGTCRDVGTPMTSLHPFKDSRRPRQAPIVFHLAAHVLTVPCQCAAQARRPAVFQIGGADVHVRCTYVRTSARHSLPAQTHGARCPSPSGLFCHDVRAPARMGGIDPPPFALTGWMPRPVCTILPPTAVWSGPRPVCITRGSGDLSAAAVDG